MSVERDPLVKSERISLLLDFYGELLSPTQRKAMESFYNDDLSLSEIAAEAGITRQGVRDRLIKGERVLTDTEEKLGLAARFAETKEGISYIIRRLEDLRAQTGAEVSDLIGAARKLL